MAGFLSGIRSGVKQNQDEAVEAAGSIRAKHQMAIDAGLVTGGVTPSPSDSRPNSGGVSVDRVRPGARFGSRGGEKRIDTKDMMRPLGAIPSFKKGGKIKKTGIIKAHKGERVLTTKQTKNLDGLAKGLSK